MQLWTGACGRSHVHGEHEVDTQRLQLASSFSQAMRML